MNYLLIAVLEIAVCFLLFPRFGSAYTVISPELDDLRSEENEAEAFNVEDSFKGKAPYLADSVLDTCVDAESSACPKRFDFDYCKANYRQMLRKCRKTCNLCEVAKPPVEPAKCVDAEPSSCPQRFVFDKCQKRYYEMLLKCRKTCHLCEVAKPPSPPVTCDDAEPSACPQRFDFTECQARYYEMLVKCRKTCHLCEVAI